ncbi:acyltransferase family protein [Arcanobacterium hippocoleae]
MALFYDSANTTRVYYGTDTHLFGLAIGVLIAFSWADRSSKIFGHEFWVRYGKYFGFGALAAVVGAIVFLPDSAAFTYRIGLFLISGLTAVVISAMLQPNSVLARIGELSVLKWFGTRSYGLYLWHWPVLVILAAAFPAAVNSSGYWIRSAIAILSTLLICEISFRYLETPIRKLGFRDYLRAIFWSVRHTLWAKIALSGCALFLILTVTGLIFAPVKSQTQLAIETAERLNTGQEEAASDAGGAAKTKDNRAEKNISEDEARKLIAQNSQQISNPALLSAALDTSNPRNEEITVIGDSMFSAAKTGLDWAMPGVKFLAKSNRQWKDAPQTVLKGYRDGMVGRAVILGFGTNAGVDNPEQVAQVIEQLGANRLILLVNLYSPSSFVESSNQILESVAEKYANVAIIDWNSLVRANPDLLQVDQTHPSIAGANAMGKLIRSRVTEFAAQLNKMKQGAAQSG